MNDEYDELGQGEGQDQEQPQQDDRYSPQNKSSNPEAKKRSQTSEAARAEAKRRAREEIKKKIAKELAKQAAKRGAQAAAGSATAGTAAVAIEAADQAYQFLKNPEEYARKRRKRILLILLAIFIFIMLVAIIAAILSQDTKGISINKTGPEAVKNGEDIKYQISLTSGGGSGGGVAGACGQKSNPPERDPQFSCGGADAGTKVSSKESSDGYYESSHFGCSGGSSDSMDACDSGGCGGSAPECNGKKGAECQRMLKYFSANADIFGCHAVLNVTNPKTGQTVAVRVVDKGPACWTAKKGRQRFDFSVEAQKAIGLEDGAIVQVSKADPNTKVGPGSCGAGGDASASGSAAPAGGTQDKPAAPAKDKTTRNFSPVAFSKFYDNMYIGRAVLQAATSSGATGASTSANTASGSATTGGGGASFELVVRPKEPDTYVINIAKVIVSGKMAYAIDTIPENATFVSATGDYTTDPPGGGPDTKKVTWKVPVDSIPGGGGGGGPVTVGNLTLPPGAQEVGQGYYRMPESTNDSYKLLGSCNTGSKELISMIYTVAQAWKQKYPQGRINIGDLNAPDHLSHKNGVDVDLEATSDGKDCVADYVASGLKGSRNCAGQEDKSLAKTIELGKMFMGTGLVKLMFYNSAKARAGIGGPIQNWPNHENHFHIRVNTKELPAKGC